MIGCGWVSWYRKAVGGNCGRQTYTDKVHSMYTSLFFYFFTKALVFNRGEKKVKRALIHYSSTIIFEEWRHQGEIQQYFKVTRSSLNCSTVLVSGV